MMVFEYGHCANGSLWRKCSIRPGISLIKVMPQFVQGSFLQYPVGIMGPWQGCTHLPHVKDRTSENVIMHAAFIAFNQRNQG